MDLIEGVRLINGPPYTGFTALQTSLVPFPCFPFNTETTHTHSTFTTKLLLIVYEGLPLVVDDKKDSQILYRMGKTCKEQVGQWGMEG